MRHRTRRPQLAQIVGGITSPYPEEIVDTLRASQSYTTTIQPGANPRLEPETGHSQVYGVVYDSVALPGFKISVNYFAIGIGNYIAQLDPQVLIENPALFPGAITRAAPTASDTAQGLPGVITQIQDLYYNYGGHSRQWRGLQRQLSPDYRYRRADAVDRRHGHGAVSKRPDPLFSVGQLLESSDAVWPRFCAAMERYRGRQPGERTVVHEPDGSLQSANMPIIKTTLRTPTNWATHGTATSNLHFDVGKALGIADRWYGKSYAELGAVNLFNNLPKYSYNGYGYDYAESDIRGRFIYLQLGIKL